MDLQQAQRQLLLQLKGLYDEREAATIADWVMEKVTGLKKIDRILRKQEEFPAAELDLLKKYGAELAAHRPVQYVLQESWFCGMKFYVDEQVLIPRPETEELVEWLVEDVASGKLQGAGAGEGNVALTILDVGTGSGCIPVALYKKLTSATIRFPNPADGQYPAPALYACDISAEALAIARRNAASHQASIDFRQLDFLDRGQWPPLPPVHGIISNPPYIPIGERVTMAPHVTGFEPALALFVEDKDPLLFYRSLADFAGEKLLPGGALFAEIHEATAAPVMQLFREAGFPLVTLRKDMQGKDRMIKATR
jgi:release factor glutamine methyltransferase